VNIQVAFLAGTLVGATGAAVDTLRPTECHPTTLNEIVSAIQESPDVEIFLVTCGSRADPAAHASIPKVGFCPIVAQRQPVDFDFRSTLVGLVQRAARDSCGVPRCLIDGGFAFRFHDRVPPLDLVIANECTSWMFLRGTKPVTFEAGLTGHTDCIKHSLRHILSAVFGETDQSFEANWPLIKMK
jgi:hypothetical protein